METEYIKRIQEWYKSNCDGDWEHSFGLSITTLDNPGWRVEIDLEETGLEDSVFEKNIDNGDDDWIMIKTEKNKFIGNGDPNKLNDILKIFIEEFLPAQHTNYAYDIYIPVENSPVKVWRPAKGIRINENTFKIIEINPDFKKDIKLLPEDFIDDDEVDFDKIGYKVGDVVTVDLQTMYDGVKPIIIKHC